MIGSTELSFPLGEVNRSERKVLLLERLLKSLPLIQVEEMAIFKRKHVPDPVIALKIWGTWFSIYSWDEE